MEKKIKILFGCEESQACTLAFRAKGFDAYSCDLLPCSGGYPQYHLQMDIKDALLKDRWDAAFFFPDCTYITCSAEWAYGDGPYHQKVKPGTLTGYKRLIARNNALQFICDLLNLCEQMGIKYYGFENPVGVIPKRIFKYYNQELHKSLYKVFPHSLLRGGLEATQYIQPFNFSEDASKKTGLWLFGLPPLTGTGYVEPRIVKGRKRWANQTDSGQNIHSPADNRALIRSKTYPGIAKAMADQWSKIINR